jgi:hypothetical protein
MKPLPRRTVIKGVLAAMMPLGRMRRAADLAGPALIPIQPMPVVTRVAHFRILGRTITAIMRQWKPGDSGPGGRCRLCARCSAHDDGCLIQVNRLVARDEAPLFAPDSIPGMTWQHDATEGGAR